MLAELLAAVECWTLLFECWTLLGERWALLGECWTLLVERWALLFERWALLGEPWALLGERWALLVDAVTMHWLLGCWCLPWAAAIRLERRSSARPTCLICSVR